MSPLEVRPAREEAKALGFSRVKLVQPGKSETVRPSYFGLGNGFHGERIHLKMSCDTNNDEGEVTLFRKKGTPRFRWGLIEFGFEVSNVEEVHYKVKRGQGKRYIRERGHKVLRIKMK